MVCIVLLIFVGLVFLGMNLVVLWLSMCWIICGLLCVDIISIVMSGCWLCSVVSLDRFWLLGMCRFSSIRLMLVFMCRCFSVVCRFVVFSMV